VIPEGRRHAFARQMIDPVLERLRRAKAGEPLFVYTHLMEPHAPYDRGRHDGTEWEKYLSEIAVADMQIQRVLRLLEQRFGDRWLLFVSADHGEAFGEHETFQHTKTLYEELLRVPLLVRGPHVARRTIAEHVGLIDLGPTILDLFGAVTPGPFEGQSLVPLLAGRDVVLDRPLLAEGRLRRALYTPDGLKVIEDTRRETVEVYDLLQDPGETRNLFDEAPARADPALATLETFFDVHALKKPGYRPPYKP
jgi:arylsulfatase A-like enzyme